MTVFNRTHALVRLRHGKAWGPEGPLKITQVQTGPMGPFPGFVAKTVAMIAPDDSHEHASGISVQSGVVNALERGAASTAFP